MTVRFSPLLRVLLAGLIAVIAGGCAAHPRPTPEAGVTPQRWVILGDHDAGPGADALAAALGPSGPQRPDVLDLSAPGAGIDALINDQFVRLGGARADFYIVLLGPADAALPAPLDPARYGALVSSLLVTLRARGQALITTIPSWAPTNASGRLDGGRLDAARRLRLLLEYNDAIRAAAGSHGALLVEQEQPQLTRREADTAALTAWRTALAASGRHGSAVPAAASPNVISGFDGAAQRALQERARRANGAGYHPDVVAKLGDSITADPAFLSLLTAADVQRSGDPALAATLAYFTRTPVPATDARALAVDAGRGGALAAPTSLSVAFSATTAATSLSRQSLAAANGWTVADALTGGAGSPLLRELDAIHPGVALVMFGTNDLTWGSVTDFEAGMDELLRALEARQVIPVLSTIPSRIDRPDFAGRVPAFNAAVRALAAVYGVPLIDYAAALAPLPNLGLAEDGIHPSVCPEGPASLSAVCLRYGYNLRNLLTLQALTQLRTLVLSPAGH